jgi:hypothetical protein
MFFSDTRHGCILKFTHHTTHHHITTSPHHHITTSPHTTAHLLKVAVVVAYFLSQGPLMRHPPTLTLGNASGEDTLTVLGEHVVLFILIRLHRIRVSVIGLSLPLTLILILIIGENVLRLCLPLTPNGCGGDGGGLLSVCKFAYHHFVLVFDNLA